MAHITIEHDHVMIRFSLWEKVLGLIGNQTIPRASLTEVAVEDDPIKATAGMRAPGLGIPGAVKLGTWRGRGRRMLVCVRRSQPAVRIETAGLRYDAFLVSVPDAPSVARQLED